MKLNKDFLIHQTDNGEILIPVGEETKRFHGVIKLNETGSEIVHLLEEDEMSLFNFIFNNPFTSHLGWGYISVHINFIKINSL